MGNENKKDDQPAARKASLSAPTGSRPTVGRQACILGYIKGSGNKWCSPTEIGRSVWGIGHHSSSASPVCLRMVKKGWLERNEKGHYRIPENVEDTREANQHQKRKNNNG